MAIAAACAGLSALKRLCHTLLSLRIKFREIMCTCPCSCCDTTTTTTVDDVYEDPAMTMTSAEKAPAEKGTVPATAISS